jgi:cysteine desulfurase
MTPTNNLIYFNNNRSTRLDPEVAAAMTIMEATTKDRSHLSDIIRQSKLKVAAMLNCHTDQIVFTAGTTPAIRSGIFMGFKKNSGRGKHVITVSTEHPAVLDSCQELIKLGATITCLPVDREGLIDIDHLTAAIQQDTCLVCIMAANNETGVLQDIPAISEICRNQGILFFSDASQYVAKIRCDVAETGFDLLAFGSHKMHGPPGIGVLFSREGFTEEDLLEHALEPEIAKIAGLGKASEIFDRDYWEINAHVSRLRNHLEHQLLELPQLRINGSTRSRLYNTSNLYLPLSVDIRALLERFDFAHNLDRPSHVLKAMGLSDADNRRSCRISFGKYNSLEEVNAFLQLIPELY